MKVCVELVDNGNMRLRIEKYFDRYFTWQSDIPKKISKGLTPIS